MRWEAGRNVVDGDAARAQFACQAAGQARDRGFGHRVDGDSRHWDPVGVDAADCDDPTTRVQVRHRGLDGGEHAAHVDCHQSIELIKRKVFDWGAVGHASVVDEDVQPAESLHGLLDRVGDRLDVAAVGSDGDHRSSTRTIRRPTSRLARVRSGM